MYQQRTNRIFLALGLVLFAAGMAAGAVWDMSIDYALHSPGNFAAVLMECFGYYPQYLPAVLLLLCLGLDKQRGKAARIALICAGAVCACALAVVSAGQLQAREIGARAAACMSAAVWGLLALGAWAMLRRIPAPRLQKLTFVFTWGTAYLLLSLGVINLLKMLWNRTRFDDMLASGGMERFTSWLRPLGNGGTSFPSGHTAAACSVFVLVLLCDVFPAWHKRRLAVWCACWAYIAGMALSRLVMGRHFLSDTVMAAFVGTLLFLLMTKSGAYRQGARRLTPPGGQPAPENSQTGALPRGGAEGGR